MEVECCANGQRQKRKVGWQWLKKGERDGKRENDNDDDPCP